MTELFDEATAIGNPMATWRYGKVVWSHPDDIQVDMARAH
jgi:hypothetical protein